MKKAETVIEAAVNAEEKDPQFAYTLAKGLDVLQAFDVASPFLGNREIAERTGLARPTVARLTRTLALRGFLKYNESTARYRLTASVLSFGYPLLSQLNIRQLARAQMQQLADYAKGAVSLGLRSGPHMVIIESCVDTSAPTGRPDIGATREMVATSMGLAYYAAAGADERAQIDQLLRQGDPQGWPASRRRLQAGCRQFGEKGYCTSITPSAGIVAVATSMRSNFDGETLSINCAVAPFNLQPEQLEKHIAPRLLNLARMVEHAQGLR